MCAPTFINYIWLYIYFKWRICTKWSNDLQISSQWYLQIIWNKSFTWSRGIFLICQKHLTQSDMKVSSFKLLTSWCLWKILRSNKLISQKQAPKSCHQWSVVVQVVSHQSSTPRGPSGINTPILGPLFFLVAIHKWIT